MLQGAEARGHIDVALWLWEAHGEVTHRLKLEDAEANAHKAVRGSELKLKRLRGSWSSAQRFDRAITCVPDNTCEVFVELSRV